MSLPVGFAVRSAAPDDIEAVMAIERDCFPAGIREDRSVFLGRIGLFPEGFLLCTAAEGWPVGYLSSELWPFRDEPDRAWFTLNHAAGGRHRSDGTELYVSSLAVKPALRGRGLAGALLDGILDYIPRALPGVASSILLVNERWAAARSLYRRAGYAEIASFPGFFPSGAGEPTRGIVMRKYFGANTAKY